MKPLIVMLAEIAATFASGEAYYYRGDGHASADDWQLPANASALERKVAGDGIRFDSNGFVTNTVKHPLIFGAGVHVMARENGYSVAQSFLISSAVSIGWEFIGEWREYASINDLLTTSTAGTPVGEAVYQLVHHAREARWDVRAGVGSVAGVSFRTVGAAAALDGVRLAVELPFDHALRAVDLTAKARLTGTRQLGIAASYDFYEKMDRPEWQWDLLANVKVGPTTEVELHAGDATLRAGLDATADFAMVRSMAYGAWRDAHPMAIVQGVLQTNPHYYYYAAGVSLEPRLAIEAYGLTAGVSASYVRFSSLDGHDRDQEITTTQIHLTDQDARATAWLGARWNDFSVRGEVRAEHRSGQIGALDVGATERTGLVTLGYSF